MINILRGDVTNPVGEGKKIIVHVVNDIPCMGAGVAAALMKKWPAVREEYMVWGGRLKPNSDGHDELRFAQYNKKFGRFQLGNVQSIEVEKDVYVANLVGQKDVTDQTICNVTLPPVRYESIKEGLLKTLRNATKIGASVHAPLLGAGLAGGKLDYILQIMSKVFGSRDVNTHKVPFYLYSFDSKDYKSVLKWFEASLLPFKEFQTV